MALEHPISSLAATPPQPGRLGELLVYLVAMPPEQAAATLSRLAESLGENGAIIATSSGGGIDAHPNLRVVATPATTPAVTLTASDYVNAFHTAREHGVHGILMLGQESSSLSAVALTRLAQAVQVDGADLVLPIYELPPRSGLVNSAILFPLTRALFASQPRFPLAIDVGMSLRMAERMADVGQRFTAANQNETPLWPTNEAVVAGYAMAEVDAGTRSLPHPSDADVNGVFATVAGSFFADVDAKASFWQRARPFPPMRPLTSHLITAAETPVDIAPMVEAFRLAYTHLQEIWSLVLPPNSLLALKRLSVAAAPDFRMADHLWARIVYDLVLAYRLRTINRGHLLGALIPLYLAWVASHINLVASGIDAEQHVQTLASTFESDKPYLVSRWRWPDRFNP